MNDFDGVEQTAMKQVGLVSREQVLMHLSRKALATRMHRGDLDPVHRGVYRLRGTPFNWMTRAMGLHLLLGPGSALSHTSSAFLFGLDGLEQGEPPVFELTAPRSRTCDLDDVVLHLTHAPAVASVRCRELPVTTLERTLIDLAGTMSEPALELALDSARRLHKLNPAALLQAIDDEGNGRKGIGVLRALLAARKRPLDSALEVHAARLLRERGIRAPREQVEIGDPVRQQRIMRIDFVWLPEKIALHVDGFAFHSSRRSFDDDHEKRNRLSELGWFNVTVTSKLLASHAWTNSIQRELAARARRP